MYERFQWLIECRDRVGAGIVSVTMIFLSRLLSLSLTTTREFSPPPSGQSKSCSSSIWHNSDITQWYCRGTYGKVPVNNRTEITYCFSAWDYHLCSCRCPLQCDSIDTHTDSCLSSVHRFISCFCILISVFTFLQRQASWPSSEGSGDTCFSRFWPMNMEEGKL